MAGKVIFIDIPELGMSSETPIIKSLCLPKSHRFISSGCEKVPSEYGEVLGLYFVIDISCEETINVQYLLVETDIEFPSQALYRYVCSIQRTHIFEILPDVKPDVQLLNGETLEPTYTFEEYEDDDEQS